MICRTLPTNGTRLSACAPGPFSVRSRPIPGPPATPGKRLAALEVLIHPNSLWGESNPRFCTSNPKLAQPSFFLRLSFSSALSERLSCSLNLIEPHLGPDLRSMLSVDLGTAHGVLGYDPRNPYASSCNTGICGNPRYYSESSSGTSTHRNTHGEISTPKPAEHHDLTLDNREVQLLKRCLVLPKHPHPSKIPSPPTNTPNSPRKPLGHLPSPEDGPSP